MVLVFLNNNYINLLYLFVFGFLLVGLGFYGFSSVTTNIILFLISTEVVLLGLIFILITIDEMYSSITGQFFSLILLTVAAVETSVILVIILVYHKYNFFWDLNLINIISYSTNVTRNI